MNFRLGLGHTVHERFGRAAHRFRYPAFFVVFRTEAEPEFRDALRRRFFGALSFRAADHLKGESRPADAAIREFLRRHCNFEAEAIWLVTMPRMFGYVFNPVSFWLCKRNGKLEAVLAEVNNTFGERHYYWVVSPPDGQAGWTTTRKDFHVSPFLPVGGSYRFAFRLREDFFRADVHYQDEAGAPVLGTWLEAPLVPLTDLSLARLLWSYGWLTPLVVARIHWQAFKLWRKGAVFHRKPTLPHREVSL